MALISFLISSDGQRLISGGADGFIKILNLKTCSFLQSISTYEAGKQWSVKRLTNSPRPNKLFFGYWVNGVSYIGYELNSNQIFI